MDKKNGSEKTNILKNLLWSIKNINHYDKKFIFFSVFISILQGIVPPILLLLTQQLINGIQLGTSFNMLLPLCMVYIGIDTIRSIIMIGFNYYQQSFSRGFNLFMNNLILKKASKLSLQDYENSEVYDKINRAQQESNGKLVNYVNTFINVFSGLISILSYALILINFSPILMMIVLCIPILKFLINRKFNIERFVVLNNRTHDARKTWYVQYLLTYGLTFKELKINALFDHFINKYKEYNKKFIKQDLKIEKKNSKWMLFLVFFESLLDGSVLGFIIYSAVNKVILIGNVTTLLNSISQIKQGVSTSLTTLSAINKESLFIDQIKVYFNIEENNDSGRKKIEHIDKIEVRNLSFKYESQSEYTLKNLNFSIEKGETVLIVGQNGSGKTTLLKIISGLYTNYEGEVLVNGINLKEIDKNRYHKLTSVIFQDFIRYEGTFRENIAYGNLDKIDDTEALDNIINRFDLGEVVQSSPKGIDTQVGHWFDNGIQISAGQWQKLSICRAMVKCSDLMIFDEPNSALDSVSEIKLAKLYSSMLRNKLGIIIAHNFKNFSKKADSILVLEKGKISGIGTHSKLFNSNKEYRRLYCYQIGKEYEDKEMSSDQRNVS